MSQFEYVAIAVSLVLSFGVVRILNGFSHVLNGENRYWVHTLWVVVSLANFAVAWWGFWSASDVPAWHLGSFLAALMYPALLYVGAALLVPGDASRITRWRSHFYGVRRPLFLTYLVATVFALGVGIVAAEWSTLELLGGSIFTAIYTVGLVSRDERVHRTLVIVALATFVAMYVPAIYIASG